MSLAAIGSWEYLVLDRIFDGKAKRSWARAFSAPAGAACSASSAAAPTAAGAAVRHAAATGQDTVARPRTGADGTAASGATS